MEGHRRGADGRRIFSTTFRLEQIVRVERREVTLAELSRELSVSPSVIRRWKHLRARGSTTAMSANDDRLLGRLDGRIFHRCFGRT